MFIVVVKQRIKKLFSSFLISDHYRVTTNVTSEVCSPPLRNKQSKEFKAFAKRFSQSVYKEMGDVVIEVDIKSVM